MTQAIELESAKLLSQFSGDRQNFLCSRHTAFRGRRSYQVMSLPKGFLFIDLPTTPVHGQPGSMELGMAAGIGRLLGGHAGSQLAQLAVMGANAGGKAQIDQTYELASDEELRAVVNNRRLSFDVKYADIKWATIDAARAMSNSAGLIRFKAKKVGKVKLELLDTQDMLAASDVFQGRLGEKVKLRAIFDRGKMRFVKCR